MVLHNDKWKYKAKKAVERKNAAKGKKTGVPNNSLANQRDGENNNSDTTADSGSDDEDNDEDDDDEEDEVDADGNIIAKKKKKEKKPESNAWRFADPVTDESILKDPEYIAQLEAVRKEEEDRMNYMRSAVSEKLSHGQGDDETDKGRSDYLLSGNKEISSLKKLKQDHLTNWSAQINGEDTEDEGEEDKSGPQVREFTEAEKTHFMQLQQKIKHQKEVAKLKSNLNARNNAATRGRVLELDTGRGKDNYRHIVDKRLGRAQNPNGPDIGALDDLVSDMLGIDLKKTDEGDALTTTSSGHFDVDNLISKSTAVHEQSRKRNSGKIAPVVLQTTAEDDDFLDSLL